MAEQTVVTFASIKKSKSQTMALLNRVLVGLDFSRTDSQVLTYLKGLSLISFPEKIFFTNIHSEIDVPSEILEQFPDLKSSINNTFIKELVEETNAVNFVGCEKEYVALEGNLLFNLIEKSTNDNIDLVVVGRKNKHGAKGLEHKKIVRKSPCGVLIIPENSKPIFKNIFLATDFSEYSKIALQEAISLAHSSNGKIVCQHVYEVPTGYSKTGKTFTQFAAIMRENAEVNFKKYIKDIDTKGVKIEPVFTLSNHREEAENIAAVSRERKSDLVIIGSKGRTNLSAILLGSITEALLDELYSIPILVVKKKGDQFDFIDAIKAA